MELSILRIDVPELGFEKGDIHEIFPDEKILHANLTMMVRGRSPAGIPFNKNLFKKYYTRYIVSGKSFVRDNDPSEPAHILKSKWSKFEFRDQPKFENRSNLKELLKDVKDNFEIPEHPYFSDEFIKFWNWGVEDLKIFMVIRIDESYLNGKDYREFLIEGEKKRKFKIDFNTKKKDLELDQKISKLWSAEKNSKFKSFCQANLDSRKNERIEDYLKTHRFFPARYDLNLNLSIIGEK